MEDKKRKIDKKETKAETKEKKQPRKKIMITKKRNER